MPKQVRNIEWNIVAGPPRFSPNREDWAEAERLLGVPLGAAARRAFIAIYESYLKEKNLENAAEPLNSAYSGLQRLSEMVGAADIGNVEALRVFQSHLAHVRIEVDLAPPTEAELLGLEREPIDPRAAWISPAVLHSVVHHLKAAAAGALAEVSSQLQDEDRLPSEPRRAFSRGRALRGFLVSASAWSRSAGAPSSASNSSDQPFPKFLFHMLGLAPVELRETRLASVQALSARIIAIRRARKVRSA